MDGTKSLFTSVTFWGSIVSLLALVFASFGFNVVDTDVAGAPQQISDLITAVLAGDWKAVGTAALGIVGLGVTIYGRLRATKAIK